MKVVHMNSNTIRTTGVAVLSLLLGIGASGYAAQEHPGDKQQDHAKPQQGGHEQARPAQQQHAQARPVRQQPRQTESKPQAHAEPQQQKARETHAPPQQRQVKPSQQHMQQARGHAQPQRESEQQRVQQTAWQQHRASNWQSDHRTWTQRGGYSGYRIPDDRFRGHFGQNHGFHIGGLPFLVIGGYPRFQYQGYWFSMVDPYPGSWADNWYDTDDVYVTYADNGYYLYDTRYPGIGIAISISM